MSPIVTACVPPVSSAWEFYHSSSGRLQFLGYLPLAVYVGMMAAGCGDRAQQQSNGSKTIIFSNGKVEFRVPKGYVETSEPDDAIAIRPPGTTGITLRFNLHYLRRKVDDSPDLGVEFIHAKAAKDGLEVERIGNKVLLTTGTTEGDRQVETTFWLIGFQRAVVLMSVEVDQSV